MVPTFLLLLCLYYCSEGQFINESSQDKRLFAQLQPSNQLALNEQDSSMNHLDSHVHKLLDIAIDKLSSKVLVFSCARNDGPPLSCKTVDTMTICFNNSDIVVMGIPLMYKTTDYELRQIVSWISRCSVQNKTENGYVTQLIIDRLRQTPIL
ncbi:unnamed protein product [Auanema sp. JU1783]|nr:unnamed protein product [Auanema sp. JU1783]